MNTPKTAALWELLREMGWSEDQRPVSFIMQSHEELEKQLVAEKESFAKRLELSERAKRSLSDAADYLNRRLSQETARADDQFALAMELAAKLETERALTDMLADSLDGAQQNVFQQEALDAYFEARNETKP